MTNEPIMTVGGLPEHSHIGETRDGLLETRVSGALVTEHGLESRDIEVSAHGDAVQLSGYVPDEMQVEKAREIAEAVEGVERVASSLAVKKLHND